MAKIVTYDSLKNFNFEALTQCISNIHYALQSSAVNAINRFATIRNWLIGCYIVEYEQCGNDRAQYGAKLLQNISDRLNLSGINTTLLKNARRFYLVYPHLSTVVDSICPILSDKFPELSQFQTRLLASIPICPTTSDKFITPATTLISNLSFSHIVELLKNLHPHM